MELAEGLEPSTGCLRSSRSSIELHQLIQGAALSAPPQCGKVKGRKTPPQPTSQFYTHRHLAVTPSAIENYPLAYRAILSPSELRPAFRTHDPSVLYQRFRRGLIIFSRCLFQRPYPPVFSYPHPISGSSSETCVVYIRPSRRAYPPFFRHPWRAAKPETPASESTRTPRPPCLIAPRPACTARPPD